MGSLPLTSSGLGGLQLKQGKLGETANNWFVPPMTSMAVGILTREQIEYIARAAIPATILLVPYH